MITAIDLGCQVSNITTLEASAQMEPVSSLITQTLETMIEAADPDAIFLKRKAISTILPFAVSLERDGQQGVFDVTLRALRTSCPRKSMWHQTKSYIAALFEGSSSPSLDRVIVLISPHISLPTFDLPRTDQKVMRGLVVIRRAPLVARWATAVLAVPHTEEVGWSVVDATLQIALSDHWRAHIPIGVWAWFKERPYLPPRCLGRSQGTNPGIINHVRSLGDLEILKSYFLLVWSEWEVLSDDAFDEMGVSIQQDFCGTGMEKHREDLVERLDQVIEELGRGLEHFTRHTKQYSVEDEIQVTRKQYRRLKEAVLVVEREAAMKI
ncbi:hypothetical protein BJ322DRAFT_1071378 [Thelephora terrestris]|uniref:Uncharacterized protein n=1 Tax=Thelephora terrestris TaxID=56493 RepID=A0A9P6HC64_9AGAM|nr:hypothetical protein BJ322DRAFT_1071378 [Thelephora terrestris]